MVFTPFTNDIVSDTKLNSIWESSMKGKIRRQLSAQPPFLDAMILLKNIEGIFEYPDKKLFHGNKSVLVASVWECWNVVECFGRPGYEQ